MPTSKPHQHRVEPEPSATSTWQFGVGGLIGIALLGTYAFSVSFPLPFQLLIVFLAILSWVPMLSRPSSHVAILTVIILGLTAWFFIWKRIYPWPADAMIELFLAMIVIILSMIVVGTCWARKRFVLRGFTAGVLLGLLSGAVPAWHFVIAELESPMVNFSFLALIGLVAIAEVIWLVVNGIREVSIKI